MIDAALVSPVYRSQDGKLHIVMILRQPGGVHGGQVAFPGGKHDPEDETMLDTAIWEVKEELGLLLTEPRSSPSYRLWKPEPPATACSHTWRALKCRTAGNLPSARSPRFSALNLAIFCNRMPTPKGSSIFIPGKNRNRYHLTRWAPIGYGGFLIGSCIRLFPRLMEGEWDV
jgi:hypothetical protein